MVALRRLEVDFSLTMGRFAAGERADSPKLLMAATASQQESSACPLRCLYPLCHAVSKRRQYVEKKSASLHKL